MRPDDHSITPEIEPSTAPGAIPKEAPQQAPVPSQPSLSSTIVSKKPSFFRKWRALLISGGVLVLALVAGGIAYAVYQSPDNVMLGALSGWLAEKSGTAKGALTVTKDGTTVTGTMNIQSNSGADQVDIELQPDSSKPDQKFKLSVLATHNDDAFYVRLSDVAATLKSYAGGNMSPEALAALQPIIDKVDNTWIKVTDQDLKDLGIAQNDKTTKCSRDMMSKIQSDAGTRNSLVDLYKKYPFVKVSKQLGEENVNGTASLHYQLAGDKQVAASFAKGLKDLQFIKDYESCTGQQISTDDTTSETSMATDGTIEVWISKWDHHLTRFFVKTTDQGAETAIKVDLSLGTNPSITTPTDSRPVKDVVKDVQDLFTSLMQQAATSSDTSTIQS